MSSIPSKGQKFQNFSILLIFIMQSQSTVSSMYATFEHNIPKGKVKAWVQVTVEIKI